MMIVKKPDDASSANVFKPNVLKFPPPPPKTAAPNYSYDGVGPDPRREILYYWPRGETPEPEVVAKADACMENAERDAKPFYFPDTGKYYYIDDCSTDEDGEFHIFGIEWK